MYFYLGLIHIEAISVANYPGVQPLTTQGIMRMLGPSSPTKTQECQGFFVALHDIPETVELLWDYNDKEWALYSNSQTLPP